MVATKVDYGSDHDERRALNCDENNNDSIEELEANYEVIDEPEEDVDEATDAVMQNAVSGSAAQHAFGVPLFMHALDLEVMYMSLPKMEFASRESVISTIKSYTFSKRINYMVYESKPMTFYDKCKTYVRGCDWLIQATLIQKKKVVGNYCKAWLAKQKSIAQIFGGWEASYGSLPIWCTTMRFKTLHLHNLVVNIVGSKYAVDGKHNVFKVCDNTNSAIVRVNLAQ
ncbi:hypothetical protein Ahy_A05g022576 [Arachis hypogaea]|uniref:Transposase MuDR plant domain-containing protein n=1 Tax=Arachis hypogaea TaxID=3818 RepID=A0A445D0W5_ARAHY|nr:hypothetical protein Ahy_A05g022576 [Arachis hypogaea]